MLIPSQKEVHIYLKLRETAALQLHGDIDNSHAKEHWHNLLKEHGDDKEALAVALSLVMDEIFKSAQNIKKIL